MTTNLYEVTIVYNVMIAADNVDDAINFTKKLEKTIVNECEAIEFEVVGSITKQSQLDIDWEDGVPYGNNKNLMTCKQILAENDENEKKEYIESLTDEQKVQLLSTLTLSDIANLLNKKDN